MECLRRSGRLTCGELIWYFLFFSETGSRSYSGVVQCRYHIPDLDGRDTVVLRKKFLSFSFVPRLDRLVPDHTHAETDGFLSLGGLGYRKCMIWIWYKRNETKHPGSSPECRCRTMTWQTWLEPSWTYRTNSRWVDRGLEKKPLNK